MSICYWLHSKKANEKGVAAVSRRAHCQRQVSFFLNLNRSHGALTPHLHIRSQNTRMLRVQVPSYPEPSAYTSKSTTFDFISLSKCILIAILSRLVSWLALPSNCFICMWMSVPKSGKVSEKFAFKSQGKSSVFVKEYCPEPCIKFLFISFQFLCRSYVFNTSRFFTAIALSCFIHHETWLTKKM